MGEKRSVIKQMLELAKLKETQPAEKKPLLIEMMEGNAGINPARISVIKEDSPKHGLIELLARTVDELDENEVKDIYEHADILTAALQEVHPQHIPKWFVDPSKEDAKKRARQILRGMKDVRTLAEGLPEDFQKKAAAAYIVMVMQSHNGAELAKRLIAKAVEENNPEHLGRVLSFGKLSRRTAIHVAEIIAEGKLGEDAEEILNTAEDALWKTLKRAKDSYKIASTVMRALNKIESPEMLSIKAVKSRNGKRYTLREEILYRLKRIGENPRDAMYHARKIDDAVRAAEKMLLKRRERGRI